MNQKSRKNSFVIQAGILAAAGIISRIIGLLYRSPLAAIIGDEGNGYYSSAYNIYTIILLVSSYSIPSAISKVISQRLALKEYKNAHRIFQCALIYVFIVGGGASLFAYFGASHLVQKNAVVVLRVFAPTIFFSGILGVLRGYFQAHKSMLQTSVSQIAEQILNAVISLAAAHLLIGLVANQDDTTRAVYGAMGSALGTGAGVLIALIFMYWVYSINKETIYRQIKKDHTKKLLSTDQIFRIIIFMVTPVILSTFIYNSNTSINQKIFEEIYGAVKKVSEKEIATMYGIFAGKAVVLANIPIAIASAMSAAIIPTVSGTYARGEKRETNEKIGEAIHTTMLISIPAAVGLFSLAEPVVALLFPRPKESIELAAGLLQVMTVSIIFYGVSTLTNGVLQGIGKVNMPVINAAVALVLQIVVLVPLLLYTDLGLYAMAIAMIVYSFFMCILNGISIKRCLGYQQKYVKTFILPFLAAALMGAGAHYIYKGLYYLIKSNMISLFGAIGIGAVIYFVTAIKIGAISEAELKRFPKGGMLVGIAKKVRLL